MTAIQGCSTCEYLAYNGETGAFSCTKGVEPEEEMPGSWDFNFECDKWQFIMGWRV